MSLTKPQLYAGRFTSEGKLFTNDEEYFLSSAKDGDTSELRNLMFNEATEKDGLYVILTARKQENVLFDCEIVEQLDVISSRLIKKLLEDMPSLKGKTLNLIQEISEEIIGTEVKKTAKEIEMKPSGPLPLCALVVGHMKSAKGAEGNYKGKTINEFDFNTELATQIEARVSAADVSIVFRDNETNGYSKLPAKVNNLNPQFIVSLHLNAANTVAGGSETLYYHNSKSGAIFAKILQKHFVQKLGLRNRKTKSRRSGDRGITLLKYTNAPAVIGEPGFIDNANELTILIENKEAIADAYAEAIDEYAFLTSEGKKTRTASKVVTSKLIGTDLQFETTNLTKREFLEKNKILLTKLIEGVNTKLTKLYGNEIVKLSKMDFWILFNSECGLTRKGKIDINHIHSEGERGLLPLPENIKFWNGRSAPAWDRISSVGKNIEQFMLYLGQLKNKEVKKIDSNTFYSGFFRKEGIHGSVLREARLLSGVVHGYLYSGNFSGKTVPTNKIIQGFIADQSLPDIMGGTTYIHAGSRILVNRENNINDAVGMV